MRKIYLLNPNIMTKKLLFSLATLALATNLAMATVAPARLMQTKGTAHKAQKAVVADDTQILFEDFEQINTTTMMPEGWKQFDAMTNIKCAQPANETGGALVAFSGDYALVSMYDDENPRDAWAISSAMTLLYGI